MTIIFPDVKQPWITPINTGIKLTSGYWFRRRGFSTPVRCWSCQSSCANQSCCWYSGLFDVVLAASSYWCSFRSRWGTRLIAHGCSNFVCLRCSCNDFIEFCPLGESGVKINHLRKVLSLNATSLFVVKHRRALEMLCMRILMKINFLRNQSKCLRSIMFHPTASIKATALLLILYAYISCLHRLVNILVCSLQEGIAWSARGISSGGHLFFYPRKKTFDVRERDLGKCFSRDTGQKAVWEASVNWAPSRASSCVHFNPSARPPSDTWWNLRPMKRQSLHFITHKLQL